MVESRLGVGVDGRRVVVLLDLELVGVGISVTKVSVCGYLGAFTILPRRGDVIQAEARMNGNVIDIL